MTQLAFDWLPVTVATSAVTSQPFGMVSHTCFHSVQVMLGLVSLPLPWKTGESGEQRVYEPCPTTL